MNTRRGMRVLVAPEPRSTRKIDEQVSLRAIRSDGLGVEAVMAPVVIHEAPAVAETEWFEGAVDTACHTTDPATVCSAQDRRCTPCVLDAQHHGRAREARGGSISEHHVTPPKGYRAMIPAKTIFTPASSSARQSIRVRRAIADERRAHIR